MASLTSAVSQTGEVTRGLPLEAEGIERRFGAARVLTGVDLRVAPGSLHLVAGPNGAGKTTLLRILAGLTRPTAGAVRLYGESLRARPALRSRLGLLSHQSLLYDELTPLENLAFAARLHGIRDPAGAAREALAAVRLSDRADDRVRKLSRGMIQRVAIARALIHRPAVLLLDEPFTGLDVVSAARVVEMLRDQLGAGTAVVLVSHNLAEAWGLASRVSVLVRGRWAIDEPRPAELDPFMVRMTEALRD